MLRLSKFVMPASWEGLKTHLHDNSSPADNELVSGKGRSAAACTTIYEACAAACS